MIQWPVTEMAILTIDVILRRNAPKNLSFSQLQGTARRAPTSLTGLAEFILNTAEELRMTVCRNPFGNSHLNGRPPFLILTS